MPTSVHKILIHGASVIEHAILPIGELSEEAQEAKNKDIRRFREYHTRKSSKLKNNEDLFKRLLLSSDPYISSFHSGMNNKKESTDPADLRLLTIPEKTSSVQDLEEEKEEEGEEEEEEEEDHDDEHESDAEEVWSGDSD